LKTSENFGHAFMVLLTSQRLLSKPFLGRVSRPAYMKRRNKSAKQTLSRTHQKKPSPLLFQLAEFPLGRLPVTLCVAYLLSCTLILAAAVGDLWLDEIWSIQFARAASSPINILSVFTTTIITF
jgi:hypothetical protein